VSGQALRLALGRLFVVAVVLACASSTFGYIKHQIPGWRSYVALREGLVTLERVRPSGVATDVVLVLPYRGAQLRVAVPVDTAYLAAARRVDGSALFGTDPLVRAASVRAVFAEQRHDPFVSAMAERLGVLRSTLRLSDDDYVDMVARAVQTIPYGYLHESTFMPVTTVAENRGVCADKSLLLACVLARSGYDVGVFVFPSQAHVATAVRGLGPGLNSTGYSLIETTRVSYVGEVDRTLRAPGPIYKRPQLVLAGGSKVYSRDLQAEFVAETLERIRTPENGVRIAVLAGNEPAAKGARSIGRTARQCALARWIENHRDWPEDAFGMLAQAGPNH
jgi:hypothetical protein